ncbi:CPSF4 factor, partial [Amazona guildingii]|nr:CPSF4 factor [Amazona guildingii]
MQELVVAGVEKIRFDLEADGEQQQGAQPLPFLGMERTCASGCMGWPCVCCPFQPTGGARTLVGKLWLRGLCTQGDGCGFLHKCYQSRMPECCFCSMFHSVVPLMAPAGECSNKGCPFLRVDATTVCCPWYDRGFCRQGELLGWMMGAAYVPYPPKWEPLLRMAGPLCKYKHTRRVMCANYLVGFCPEGPKCRFMHLKAGLMTSSTDPSKVIQRTVCPWGLVQLDQAASKETGCKDALPMEPPLPVTGATQHPAVQPWDTNSCSLGTQTLPEQGTGLKCRQKGHCSSNCGKTQLEILLWK